MYRDYITPEARREQELYVSIFCDLAYTYMDKSKQQISAPEYVILAYIEKVKKQPIYRICLHTDGTVQTTCYDMLDAFSPELKSFYESVDELPKWVQDKLAVLMLLDPEKVNEEVESVGRRISPDVFWVFIGEANGDDPRSQS
jgi:hypothetical protein